jgi:hypothetical protein
VRDVWPTSCVLSRFTVPHRRVRVGVHPHDNPLALEGVEYHAEMFQVNVYIVTVLKVRRHHVDTLLVDQQVTHCAVRVRQVVKEGTWEVFATNIHTRLGMVAAV